MADELLIGKGDIVALSEVTPEIDALIGHINRIEVALQNVTKQGLRISGAAGIKELREATEQLVKASQVLTDAISNTAKAQKSANSEGLNAAKIATEQAKADRERTKSLIDQEKELERLIKAEEKQNAAGNGTSNIAPADVPFSHNLEAIEAERAALQENISTVSELDQAEADAAMSANEWAASMGKVEQTSTAAAASIPQITGALDEYTGTLRQNIILQQENKAAIAANRAEQAEIQKAMRATGVSTDAQNQKLAALKEQELILAQTNKSLSTTISNQIKDFTSAGGSINEMRAQVNLLQHSYEQLSITEKASPFGVRMKQQLDTLEPAVRAAELEVGKAQRAVGGYGAAISGAFSSAFGFIRQIAYIIPGIGIAGIIGGISDVAIDLVTALFKGKTALNGFAETYKTYTETIKSANQDAAKQITDLKILYNAATDVNQSMKTRLEAVQGLKKEFPDYFSQLSNEVILNGNSKKSYDDLTQSILASSRAKAADAELQKLATERLDIENQKQKISAATDNEMFRARKENLRTVIDYNQVSEEDLKKYSKAELLRSQQEADARGKIRIIDDRRNKALKEQADKLDIIKQKEDFLIKFATVPKLVTTVTDTTDKGGDANKSLEDRIKAQYEILERDRKARFELNKQIIQDEINKQKTIAALALPGVSEQARKEQFAAEKRLIDLTTNYELQANELKIASIGAVRDAKLQNTKLTAKERSDIMDSAQAEIDAAKMTSAERLVITKEGNRKIIEAEIAMAAELIGIQKSISKSFQEDADLTVRHLKEGDDKQKADQIRRLQSWMQGELSLIQQHQNDLIQLELDRYSKGEISKQEYELRKQKIENDAHRKSILAQIQYYEDLIRLANLAPDEEKAALKSLADYRQQLHDLDVANTEKANDKKIKSTKEFIKKYRDELFKLGNEINDTVFAFLEGGVDKQKNEIQDQIDLLDKRKEKEIEVANASILNTQDRAAAISTIEKRAAAQKEALDRRQRELDVQKAKFDRARAVASIILNTAQGITSALAAFPPDPVLAAIIGAVGALQLVRALAVPIPRYFKGKNIDSYEGPAWVDDGPDGKGNAPEMVIRKNGDTEIGGNKPRLTWLGKDDIVLPTIKDLAWKSTSSATNVVVIKEDSGAIRLEKGINKMRVDVVKAIKDTPAPRAAKYDPFGDFVYSNKSIKDFFGL
jgi:hypothetical protein